MTESLLLIKTKKITCSLNITIYKIFENKISELVLNDFEKIVTIWTAT